MAKKCCESVTVKSQWGNQSIRCPKNATKFFLVKCELVQDQFGDSTIHILGCCAKHARGKTKSESWGGLIRGPIISVEKSSEQELLERELRQKHASLLREFQAMFSRPLMRDKTREEIIEIFTQALDEHCVKQVINS